MSGGHGDLITRAVMIRCGPPRSPQPCWEQGDLIIPIAFGDREEFRFVRYLGRFVV